VPPGISIRLPPLAHAAPGILVPAVKAAKQLSRGNYGEGSMALPHEDWQAVSTYAFSVEAISRRAVWLLTVEWRHNASG
jgi:hypothetical protein